MGPAKAGRDNRVVVSKTIGRIAFLVIIMMASFGKIEVGVEIEIEIEIEVKVKIVV